MNSFAFSYVKIVAHFFATQFFFASESGTKHFAQFTEIAELACIMMALAVVWPTSSTF